MEKIDGGKKQRKGGQYLSWSINTRHNGEPPVICSVLVQFRYEDRSVKICMFTDALRTVATYNISCILILEIYPPRFSPAFMCVCVDIKCRFSPAETRNKIQTIFRNRVKLQFRLHKRVGRVSFIRDSWAKNRRRIIRGYR